MLLPADAEPPDTVPMATVALSALAASYKLSSVGLNAAVPVVAPALIVILEIVA